MPTDAKLKKLEELLKLVDESVSRADLEEAIGGLIAFVKKIENKTETDLKTIIESVKTAISRVETTASDNHAKTSEKLTKEAETLLNDARFQVEAMIAEAQKKIDEVKDGEDADEDEIVEKVIARIPEVPEVEEETPESVRDMLESIENEEDKLKIEAIRNLRKELDDLENKIKNNQTFVGGARGITVLDEGNTISPISRTLNFTGSGVTVSQVGESTVVQISGGAGGYTKAQESGTISGTTIALGHTPVADTLLLYINGQFQHPTIDYTFSGTTISNLPVTANGLTYTAIYEY